MIVVLLGEQEAPWFCICRRFETADDAYAGFVAVFESSPEGERNVGVYQHQRVGLDHAPVLVSVVGTERESVEAAERLIAEGEPTELHGNTWLVLIKRRIAVVLNLSSTGAIEGRYRIVHDEEGNAC
jgi:hypothetical protein